MSMSLSTIVLDARGIRNRVFYEKPFSSPTVRLKNPVSLVIMRPGMIQKLQTDAIYYCAQTIRKSLTPIKLALTPVKEAIVTPIPLTLISVLLLF